MTKLHFEVFPAVLAAPSGTGKTTIARELVSRSDDYVFSVSATTRPPRPDRLIALATHNKVVGIGETGLDYYYDHSPRPRQVESFQVHIEAVRQTGLPLIVHARDADDDLIRVLRAAHRDAPFSGVIHCFTAGPELARAALDLGLYISVAGVVTSMRV